MTRAPPPRIKGILDFGNLKIQPSTRTLWRAGSKIHLTPKSMDLLLYLVENRDRYVSFEELHRNVWPQVSVGPTSLPQAIKELRKQLGDDWRQPSAIRTVRGRGYQFVGAEAAELPDLPPARDPAFGILSGHQHPPSCEESPSTRILLWPLEGSHRARDLPAHSSLIAGSDPACDIVIASSGISPHHVELTRQGDEVQLRTLSADARVTVDGMPASAVALTPGAVIQAGLFRCVLLHVLADEHDRAVVPVHPAPLAFHAPLLDSVLREIVRTDGKAFPITLEGETSTGKSRIAQLLHANFSTKGHLASCACAALEARSFSALLTTTCSSPSRIHRALILDDIEDLGDLQQQALIQHLDQVERTGDGPRTVVTARHPLRELSSAGLLRPELAARLQGPAFALPPLRALTNNIPLLFSEFWREAGGDPNYRIPSETMEAWCAHDWPFNLREFRAVVHALARGVRDEQPQDNPVK